MGKAPIKVNALIDLLDRHERQALEALRRKYPAQHDILTVGTMMGTDVSQSDSAVYLDVAIEGLRAAKSRVEPNLQRLRDRLRKAKQIRLVGQIIGAITSAGVIAAIVGNWQMTVTIATALVNFAAVLCTFVAGYLETPLHGGKGNLIDSFETLAATSVEADEVMGTLDVFRRSQPEDARIMEQVSRANAIASKLRLAERMLWGT
jgi:hypothetical protein